MIRAFVAIPAPDDLVPALEAAQTGLRVGRLVPGENFHITLAFLDDQPVDVLEELHDALACITLPPPVIALDGLGVFGGSAPRLLFAEIAPNPSLTALRKQVWSAARSVGIQMNHKRFHPHITLARFGRLTPDELANLQNFIARRMGFAKGDAPAPGFALFASIRAPEGAIYDPMAEYDFNPVLV